MFISWAERHVHVLGDGQNKNFTSTGDHIHDRNLEETMMDR
jgi:hypothetical protein